MKVPRERAAAIFYHDIIYIAGGLNEEGEEKESITNYGYTEHSEFLPIRQNKSESEPRWHFLCPLHENYQRHILAGSNHRLYCFNKRDVNFKAEVEKSKE